MEPLRDCSNFLIDNREDSVVGKYISQLRGK
jgi:hypothetical protein